MATYYLRSMPLQKRFGYLLVPMLLIICGCSGNDGIQLHQVTGTVLVDGKPANGAEITLFTLGDQESKSSLPIPKAVTDSDGKFSISSISPNDGAPIGKYSATVIWLKYPDGLENSNDPEAIEKAYDRLNGYYSSISGSPLIIEVSEGNNQLEPFQLSKNPKRN